MSFRLSLGSRRALALAPFALVLALFGCADESWRYGTLSESLTYEASSADAVDEIAAEIAATLAGTREEWLQDASVLWSGSAASDVLVVFEAMPADAETPAIGKAGGELAGPDPRARLEYGFRIRRGDPERSPAGSLALDFRARYELPASMRRSGEQALLLLRDRTVAAFARQLDRAGRERGASYRAVDWKSVPEGILVEHLGAR